MEAYVMHDDNGKIISVAVPTQGGPVYTKPTGRIGYTVTRVELPSHYTDANVDTIQAIIRNYTIEGSVGSKTLQERKPAL